MLLFKHLLIYSGHSPTKEKAEKERAPTKTQSVRRLQKFTEQLLVEVRVIKCLWVPIICLPYQNHLSCLVEWKTKQDITHFPKLDNLCRSQPHVIVYSFSNPISIHWLVCSSLLVTQKYTPRLQIYPQQIGTQLVARIQNYFKEQASHMTVLMKHKPAHNIPNSLPIFTVWISFLNNPSVKVHVSTGW
jgi:hypothetical protein